jgi:hypothetical protein
MLKKTLQFFLFLGLGATILTLVYNNQNKAFQEQCRLDGVSADDCSLIHKLLFDFSTVHLGWLGAVLVAFTLSNVFRALRWQMLLDPMGYPVRFSNSFLSILLGYFANLGFPRMGEIVRAGSLARYENIPMEKVVGTLVIDRLMDFICLGVVVGLAFVFEGKTLLDFLEQSKGGGASSGGGNLWQILLLVLAVGMVLLFVFRKRLAQLALVVKVINLLKGFWEGMKSVLKLKNPLLFLFYSVGIWLLFYLQCWLNLMAFPPTQHLTFGAALMVFVFGTLGFVIPSPGGMGTFHALCIAGLALYGINGSDAFSYANISFFSVQIFYNILAGVLALVLMPVLKKKVKQ